MARWLAVSEPIIPPADYCHTSSGISFSLQHILGIHDIDLWGTGCGQRQWFASRSDQNNIRFLFTDNAFRKLRLEMDGNILIRQLLFLPDYKSYYFTFSRRDGGGIKLPTQPRGLLKDDVDILFTTGGTGIGSRDITPDVIGTLLTMELPGIMDLVRLKYGENNPGALLSRSIAGTINKTLVFALPGSVNAVKEYTEEIVKILEHSIFMLHDISQH